MRRLDASTGGQALRDLCALNLGALICEQPLRLKLVTAPMQRSYASCQRLHAKRLCRRRDKLL
jgi:hypothetical protein